MMFRGVQQVSSQFDRLPSSLVARILGHVEQVQRLSSCATVCKCWAAAATAATVAVDFTCPFDCKPDAQSTFFKCVTGLQPWLGQHSSQLVSLRLTPCCHYSSYWRNNAELQLRCLSPGLQQLVTLELEHIKLSLLEDTSQQSSAGDSSNSSSQALSPMLPKLTELQLVACKISAGLLAQLLQLSSLSSLKLKNVEDSHGDPLEEQDLYSTVLPHLSNLVHLELSYGSDYTPLAKMFPTSLTALSLHGGQLDSSCSLTQLVYLQKLDLDEVKFNPVVISSMSKLLHLQLLWPQQGVGGADSVAFLLAAVGGMRQLQHFSLTDEHYTWDSQSVLARHFSALTASTHLTCLKLRCMRDQPLPAGAVQHMFPAGKQFPELQDLAISTYSKMPAGPGHVTTAELRNVISACPAISGLDIACALQPDADIHALLQLSTSCRSLDIGGEAFGDEAAVVIAQLTQLTRLSWQECPDLTDAGLNRLTALRTLKRLTLRDMDGLSDGLVPKPYGDMCEDFELTAGDQPVWQQLREKIRRVPCNAAWSHCLEQETSTVQLRLDALSSYMDGLLQVMTFCAGNADVMQSVRSMADLGRKVLSGSAAAAGMSAAVGALSGVVGVVGLGQQYRELHEPVKEFCSSSKEVMDALACMEAAVLQAVEGAS